MNEQGEQAPIVLAVASAIASLFLGSIYRYSLVTYFKTMTSEEYSYLLVVGGLILMIFLVEHKSWELTQNIGIHRILSVATLLTVSFTLLLISDLMTVGVVELKALSLITLGWGIIILVFSERALRRLIIPLLFMIFLVPVPREFLDPLANAVSLFSARIVCALTGASLTIDQAKGMYILMTPDVNGIIRTFNVAPICGGIVSLLGIIAIAIIPLYFASKSKRPLPIRIGGIFLGLLAGGLIVLAGNILRIASIIWATQHVGYDYAIGLFHTIPSLIYVSIATLIAIFVSMKVIGLTRKPKEGSPLRNLQLNRFSIAGIFLFSLVAFSIFSFSYSSGASTGVSGGRMRPYQSISTFLSNVTSEIFEKSRVNVTYMEDVSALAEVLGASIVKRFYAIYESRGYTGYLEVAETPSRYHSWFVCLAYQGYIIDDSWTVELNGTTIAFIRFRKGGYKMLMGYSLFKFPVTVGGKLSAAYVRVSIMGTDFDESRITEMLSTIKISPAQKSNPYENLMIWINACIALSLMTILYLGYSIFRMVKLEGVKKWLGRI